MKALMFIKKSVLLVMFMFILNTQVHAQSTSGLDTCLLSGLNPLVCSNMMFLGSTVPTATVQQTGSATSGSYTTPQVTYNTSSSQIGSLNTTSLTGTGTTGINPLSALAFAGNPVMLSLSTLDPILQSLLGAADTFSSGALTPSIFGVPNVSSVVNGLTGTGSISSIPSQATQTPVGSLIGLPFMIAAALVGAFVSAGQGILGAIGGLIGGVVNSVMGIVNSVVSAFSSVIGGIGSAISGVIGGVANGVSSVVGGVANGVSSVVGGISSGISSIGKSIGSIF
mgnify:CR=1 FL=1